MTRDTRYAIILIELTTHTHTEQNRKGTTTMKQSAILIQGRDVSGDSITLRVNVTKHGMNQIKNRKQWSPKVKPCQILRRVAQQLVKSRPIVFLNNKGAVNYLRYGAPTDYLFANGFIYVVRRDLSSLTVITGYTMKPSQEGKLWNYCGEGNYSSWEEVPQEQADAEEETGLTSHSHQKYNNLGEQRC